MTQKPTEWHYRDGNGSPVRGVLVESVNREPALRFWCLTGEEAQTVARAVDAWDAREEAS